MIFPIATLPLSSKHRVSQITFHPSKPYLAVQSHDRSVEIFRIRTEEEVRKKQARRKKRAKEKKEQAKAKGKQKDAEDEDMDQDPQELSLADLFTPYLVARASGKVRSFVFPDEESGSKGNVHIFMALSTNALEVYGIPPPTKSKDEPPEASRILSVDLPGHRADVRTLCLSSDDVLLASASNGSLKVWNMKTTACIRTIDCGYAICSTFLPGDRQVMLPSSSGVCSAYLLSPQIAVGTKSGEILLYDVASSTLIETIKAHSSTVWSIHVRADGQALVSGSADKDVKFWEFEQKATDSDNVGCPETISGTC